MPSSWWKKAGAYPCFCTEEELTTMRQQQEQEARRLTLDTTAPGLSGGTGAMEDVEASHGSAAQVLGSFVSAPPALWNTSF
ncbi:MAG: hypothetical protein ACLSHU_03880 [Oscillospiraceae bacterium]